MLVYANRLVLEPIDSFEHLVAVVARWLKPRAGIDVTAASLFHNATLKGKGCSIESAWALDQYPMLGSIRFAHPDREVAGRQWMTDIGLKVGSPSSEVECTVLLQTSDISTRVGSVPLVTRPQAVRDVLQAFPPSLNTPGVQIERLDQDNASLVAERIFSAERRSPFVVVSPTPDGDYLVDPQRLQSLLVGLADIGVIPTNADAFAVREVLGFHYSAWLGGINIVQPYFRQEELPSYRRLLPDDLVTLGDNAETEVLSLVTHRMNLPMSWTLTSADVVARELQRRRLAVRLEAARSSGELADYAKLLEQELEQSQSRIADLTRDVESREDDVAFWESQTAEMEDQLKEQRFVNAQLQVALNAAGGNGAAPAFEAVRENLLRAVSGEPTVEDALALINAAFPDRVVVLETGWRSAAEARAFRYGARAFELLWKLVTDYWSALSEGRGDTTARAPFGQAYAPNESETVAGNSGAMARRTFEYRGQAVTMERHLKIGVKDSVAETWRCHFEWMPDEKKILIGHCGRHLDFR